MFLAATAPYTGSFIKLARKISEAEAMPASEKTTSGYYREEFGRIARFYDFGVRQAFRWAGGEIAFRCGIVAAADVRPGQRLLDVACGTGTLVRLLAESAGDSGGVTGVDMSERMLAVARRKAEAEGLGPPQVEFVQANAENLPFSDGSFDRVTASLAIHELNRQGRTNALAELKRVLKPAGLAVITDMRPPDTPLTRLGMRIARLAETDTLTDMWQDGLFRELGEAGFDWRRRQIAARGLMEIIVARKLL